VALLDFMKRNSQIGNNWGSYLSLLVNTRGCRMARKSTIPISIMLLLFSSLAAADSPPEITSEYLVDQYQKLSKTGAALAATLPIYLKTEQEKNVLNVRLLGRFPFKFSEVADVLARPASYCDFLPLLFNVKSCVITEFSPVTRIKFYVAGKHYASPLASYRIQSVFSLVERTDKKIRIRLDSNDNSSGKNGYNVDLVAIPMNSETLLYLKSRYAPGRVTRMATYTYIKVFAHNKPGFTEIIEPGTHAKKLITGFPAVIERSTVRAYFALKAYLLNIKVPKSGRYDACLKTWYDLNAPYKKQLYELGRDQYLEIKRRERENQLRIQEKKRQSAQVKVGVLDFSY